MGKRSNDQEALEKAGGHFKLTALLEKRYKEILFGSRPLVDTESRDVLDTLLREVTQDKIELVSEAEAVAAAAHALLGDDKAKVSEDEEEAVAEQEQEQEEVVEEEGGEEDS